MAKEVSIAVRDRDVVETESAIRVFERAWGWANLVARALGLALGLVVAVLLTLAGWIGWKEVDLAKAAQAAKQSVQGTAADSVGQIRTASERAVHANSEAASNALQLSRNMAATAAQTKTELRNESTSVHQEVAESQTELQALKRLQPEFDSMRHQLTKATADLAEQQKVLSNSEDFAKQVFSTHASYFFDLANFVQPNHSIVLPAPGGGNTIVFMLLPETPITGTLQLQYRVAVQPIGSYLNFHNLVLFFWADPANNLKLSPLVVSYFPDKSDKDTIKSLSLRDGRVFADDQPFPKFGQPDPDWHGNKWMLGPPPNQPSKSTAAPKQ